MTAELLQVLGIPIDILDVVGFNDEFRYTRVVKVIERSALATQV